MKLYSFGESGNAYKCALALEMAAARLDTLTPSALLDRLDQPFEVLRDDRRDRSPRHAVLHQALASCWESLEPSEREDLVQLAVLPGGLTLDAAEAVFTLTLVFGAFAFANAGESGSVAVLSAESTPHFHGQRNVDCCANRTYDIAR